ncbi:uncharacterized protein [Paramisgurnus dabryanus]|uniref:uncharacterized protein n=1 Tax=Paramisgurnus dabryanus TaxID=90735 RepID=UPI003CCEFCDD
MQQLQIQVEQQRPVAQPPLSATSAHQPIPAPRNTQTAGREFRPVPAPRFRLSSAYSQLGAKEKDDLVYQTPEAHLTGWDVPKEEESCHGRNYSPYQPEHSTYGPCTSMWRRQVTQSPQSQVPPVEQVSMYKGPTPTIPDLVHPNPQEFSRLKIALENTLPANATEMFKFQILTDHLKLEEALLIADSYCHSQYPFTRTMAALDQQYGQPHQLALQRIAELMDGPNINSGDIKAFRMFALKVRSLVMLTQLGSKGTNELQCGSHVSRLLGKLPHDFRSSFRRFIHPQHVPIPTLLDLSEWLEYEIQVQDDTSRFVINQRRGPAPRTQQVFKDHKLSSKNANILLNTEKAMVDTTTLSSTEKAAPKPYCPYCDHTKHFLNNCANFKQLTTDQKRSWIKENNRCWRCGRNHHAAECSLKMRCKQCNSRHLLVLHDITVKVSENSRTVSNEAAVTTANSCLLNTTKEHLLIRKPPASRKVLLKISKVILRNGEHHMTAYAIQDDGSERTVRVDSLQWFSL